LRRERDREKRRNRRNRESRRRKRSLNRVVNLMMKGRRVAARRKFQNGKASKIKPALPFKKMLRANIYNLVMKKGKSNNSNYYRISRQYTRRKTILSMVAVEESPSR